jgi:hypothetical protein
MPPLGACPRLLGLAGLLPQVAAVLLVWGGHGEGGIDKNIAHGLGQFAALTYAAVILSFLGGIWWGFAVRRETGQARLAAIAVIPSLVAAATVGVAFAGAVSWSLVALGSAVLLTLLVDRHLTRTGEATAEWLHFRVPLSVGLGALTILAGAITEGPVTHF